MTKKRGSSYGSSRRGTKSTGNGWGRKTKRSESGERERKNAGVLTALIVTALIVLAAVVFMAYGGRIVSFLREAGLIAGSPAADTLELRVIDVGQGDALLVRTKKADLLIDAGTNLSEEKLYRTLAEEGVKKLDCFICTHPHEDHIGGADMILTRFRVGTLLMPEAASDTSSFRNLLDAAERADVSVTPARAGGRYVLGGMTLTVLSPDPAWIDPMDLNTASVVLRIDWGETSFLFMGDATAAVEAQLLERYDGALLDAVFLKVGHHVSDGSSTEAFLKAVSPTAAAISCGEGNDYGHPHRPVLLRLNAAGVSESDLLRTDRNGTFVVTSDGKTLRVSTRKKLFSR